MGRIFRFVFLLAVMGLPFPADGKDPLADMDIFSIPDAPAKEKRIVIGGYLETRNRIRITNPDDPLSYRQRLWLEGTAGNNRAKGFVSAYVEGDPAIRHWDDDDGDMTSADVGEAIVTVDTRYVDVTAGRKMVRWGTADGVNTMDLINPVDVKDPIGNARSDSRKAIPLLDVAVSAKTIILEGVLIPKPRVNSLPPEGSPWEPHALKDLRRAVKIGEIVPGPRKTPGRWFHNPEFGFRIFATRRGVDLCLLYFNGFMDDPSASIRLLPDGRFMVTPEYDRFQAFGFNFAAGFEKATLRGELAYKPDLSFPMNPGHPDYLAGNDGRIAADLFQAVLGVDYTFMQNLYANVQLFADRIDAGNKILGQKNPTQGVTYEVHNTFFNDDLTAGIRGLHYAGNGGGSLELFGEYKVGDRVVIAPGVLLFYGPADTMMGQFNANDMVYLRMRYSF